ncbi:hypothetical protein JAAARDRAFT_94360, partial [Jaapia argillacea MUCL 33604]
MRTKHSTHPIPSFPIYSAAFVSPNELVLGGGGGSTKSGIKNKLRLYRVESEKSFELVNELELLSGEDVPMSMAAHIETKSVVCGINSSLDQLQTGENLNCRIYGVDDNELEFTTSQGTLAAGDTEDYQKVTVFAPTGDVLLVAGSHDASLLSYPSLVRLASDLHVDGKAEIYDATFSSTQLILVTTLSLLIYALPPSSSQEKKGKQKESALSALELVQTIDRPKLPGEEGPSTFRAAKFHPTDPQTLYTISNTTPSPRSRSSSSKSSTRKAYVCKWNTKTWKVTKVRKVGEKGITVFSISPDGKMLAYGSSDLSIGILDAQTLAPLLTILRAHEFPPTTIAFNPTSNLLISGSADNSVRIVEVP